MTESYEFEKLLAGLVHADVRFITVGGLACAMCGFVRTTEDVDIVVERTPENISRLLQFLGTWGEGYGSELTSADFSDEEGAVRVIEDFPLDIFVLMRGLRYNDLSAYTDKYNTGCVEIPYLKPEGLIRLKSNSVREKDQIDISALKKLLD